MLKRFGLAGLLLAVSAVAPLSAASRDSNYNNHNQAQWTSQARHAVQVNDPRATSYNNGQDFRGGAYQYQNVRAGRDERAPVPILRSDRDDRREPVSSFHRDSDDRYSRFQFDRDDFRRR
jgi:hypothetical protein